MRETYPCSGPVSGDNGNIRCPLSGMFGDAYQLVTFKPHSMAVAPEKVVAAEPERPTGQYCSADGDE